MDAPKQSGQSLPDGRGSERTMPALSERRPLGSGFKIVKAADSITPKLVKRESISAMLDAVTILDSAREQARAILRDAAQRRDETFEAAKFEGELEGLGRYLEAISAMRVEADTYYDQAESELV